MNTPLVRLSTHRLGDVNGGYADLECWSDGSTVVRSVVNEREAAILIVSTPELKAVVARLPERIEAA